MLGNGIHLRNSITCFVTGSAYTQGVCRIRSAPQLLTAAQSDVSSCYWKKQTLVYRNLRSQAPHNALWPLEPSPSAAVASIDSRERVNTIAGSPVFIRLRDGRSLLTIYGPVEETDGFSTVFRGPWTLPGCSSEVSWPGTSTAFLRWQSETQVVSRTISSGRTEIIFPVGIPLKMFCSELTMTWEMTSIFVSMVVS